MKQFAEDPNAKAYELFEVYNKTTVALEITAVNQSDELRGLILEQNAGGIQPLYSRAKLVDIIDTYIA